METAGNTQSSTDTSESTDNTSGDADKGGAASAGANSNGTFLSAPPAAAAKPGADGKTDAAKTDAAKPDPKAGDKTNAAAVEAKLPEGVDAKDARFTEALKGINELAKAKGLNQEQAQAVAEAYFKASEPQRQAEAKWDAEQKAWRDAVQNDPDFGGAKLQESLTAANKAVTKFGGPELHKVLHDTGLGNNPAVVRAFARAGLALGEDTIAGGSGNGAAPPDEYAAMYPNTKFPT